MLQANLHDVVLDTRDGGGDAHDLHGNAPRRPLVSDERVVFEARRPPPRARPPSWGLAFFAVGVAAGLAMLGLARAAARSIAARIAFGALLVPLGAVLGGVGSFLLWAWFFTPHLVVHRNQNILLFVPLALAFIVLGPAVAAGSRRALRLVRLVASAGLSLAVIACVFKLPGLPHQRNGALILALLPFWLGLTLGARVRAAATASPPAPA
jgi:hypothetical protein